MPGARLTPDLIKRGMLSIDGNKDDYDLGLPKCLLGSS